MGDESMQRKASLKKILILFLSATILMTSIVMVIMRNMNTASVQESKRETIGYFINDQVSTIENELKSIKTAISMLAAKGEIIGYGTGESGYRAKEYKDIRSLLGDVTSYVPVIRDVMLVFQDGHQLSTNNNTDLKSFLTRRKYAAMCLQDEKHGTSIHTIYPEATPEYLLTVNIPIQKLNYSGYVIAFCQPGPLLSKLEEDSPAYAVFCGDERVAGNGAEEIGPVQAEQILRETQLNPHGEWVGFTVPELNWTVILGSPVSLVSDSWSLRDVLWDIHIMVLFAVMECILVLLIYKTVVEPILVISRDAANIQSLTTPVRNPFPERHELSILADSMNAMIARTVHLTDEINRSKTRMMEMEITTLQSQNMFLQAQIYPHFLYNMLECICGMASQNGQKDIREMTHSLSMLYRYCLKSPDSTLGEELDSLLIYQKIISLRYDKPHMILIDVPDELRSLPVPRMILEPLVENAVQHGFNHESDEIKQVIIHAEHKGNSMLISIDDNGCGMTPDQMAEVNRQTEHLDYESKGPHTGIGMFNVARRLRLVFGSNCHFQLAQSRLGGLMIQIEIPDQHD